MPTAFSSHSYQEIKLWLDQAVGIASRANYDRKNSTAAAAGHFAIFHKPPQPELNQIVTFALKLRVADAGVQYW